MARTNVIILTTGSKVIVDDIDYDYLNQWSWSELIGPKTSYAARGTRVARHYHKVMMHREIGARMGLKSSLLTDHKDLNGLNNSRANLREASSCLNNQNASLRSDSTSGFRGVGFFSLENKWKARIQIGKIRLNLGTFNEFEDAVAARLAAEERYYKWREQATDVNSFN
jgi:hypothetical protein